MRFTYYVVARTRRPERWTADDHKNPLYTTKEYYDGKGLWCTCSAHSHKLNTKGEAESYIRLNEHKWATAFYYTVEEREACDY